MDSKTGDEGEKVQAEAWISLLIAKKLSVTRVLAKKSLGASLNGFLLARKWDSLGIVKKKKTRVD